MLKLWLGRAGSGKTARVLDRAGEVARQGGRVVLVVPEQATYETERALLRSLGPKSCLSAEVLSFSRMAHRVFGVYGGGAARYIDDCGRTILMHRALRQLGDLLTVYRRQAKNSAFAGTMVQTVAEYKQCGVDAGQLTAAAQKVDDPMLARKLKDIALIYDTYEGLLAGGFADSLDDLSRLARKLEDSPFFAGKAVLVDSFKGFTPQERQVLAAVLRQADEVVVTLSCDTYDDAENGIGLFSPVRKTARQLVALANRCGVPVARPEVLGDPVRFQSDGLRALEARIFRPRAVRYTAPAPGIHLVSTANIYDEARFAAQEIARLVREEHFRFGDIVVISRELDLYRGILDPVFARYGVPLFFDTRRDVETHPLMATTLAALEIIAGDFRIDPVLRYLKAGLSGFEILETAQVENYLLTWDIEGAENWRRPWKQNPDGFAASISPAEEAQLGQLNALRERIAAPLLDFAAKLEAAPGASAMAEAVYRFLIAVGADRAVGSACRELTEAGEVELADEYRQIWDKLMNVLDQTARTLGDETMPVREFTDLLRLCITGTELGHIPPSLDQVTAGDAEHIRAGNARAVFVIGLAEGVFPRTHAVGGVLTDAERQKLIGLGLELSPPAHEQAVEERYLAYLAFTCASERLYLSCPRSDTSGRAMRPSHFLLETRALFPACDRRDDALADPIDSVQNEQTAFEMLAERYGAAAAGDPLGRALLEVFRQKPEYAEKLRALETAWRREPARLRDAGAARALFGEKMFISPTRLENYEQCRFLYFCRYGLGARPRRKAGLMAPEIGTMVHFVLEKLLSGLGERKLWEVPDTELEQMVDELLDEFATGFFGGLADKPQRFRYLYGRLRGTVLALVAHIGQELARSDFYPVDFELAIRENGDVKPAVIPLPDGGSIAVEGNVDRVDRMQKNGETWLRVIDYKTGAKTFRLSDVIYGLNMQMLIYLFTLCDGAGPRYGGQPRPAGILYMPARRPVVPAVRGAAEGEIEKGVDSQLRMNGLVAAEPAVIEGMERGADGIYIPARLKADGTVDARSSVASLAQLGTLQRHIRTTLRAMARTLRAGDIAAVPVQGLDYHPCDYCDFAGVCGHEKGDRVRFLSRFDTDAAWDALKGDESDA